MKALNKSRPSSIADAATRSAIDGTSFGDNLRASIPNVIGQAIGNALVDGIRARASEDEGSPVNGALSAATPSVAGIADPVFAHGTATVEAAAKAVENSSVRRLNTVIVKGRRRANTSALEYITSAVAYATNLQVQARANQTRADISFAGRTNTRESVENLLTTGYQEEYLIPVTVSGRLTPVAELQVPRGIDVLGFGDGNVRINNPLFGGTMTIPNPRYRELATRRADFGWDVGNTAAYIQINARQEHFGHLTAAALTPLAATSAGGVAFAAADYINDPTTGNAGWLALEAVPLVGKIHGVKSVAARIGNAIPTVSLSGVGSVFSDLSSLRLYFEFDR